VQGRDNRHTQIPQQCQDVAPRLSAEYPVLELKTDKIDVIDIEEVSSARVRMNVFFSEFKTNPARIRIACFRVVDRQGNARRLDIGRCDGLTQVRCKRGDAALPR